MLFEFLDMILLLLIIVVFHHFSITTIFLHFFKIIYMYIFFSNPCGFQYIFIKDFGVTDISHYPISTTLECIPSWFNRR